MKLSDVKSSRFLRKEDLGEKGKMLLTIKSASMENVAPTNEAPDMKCCIAFQNAGVKPMVVNATNFASICEISGKDDSDNWADTKIVVWFNPAIEFGGQKTGGLRVRKPQLKEPEPVAKKEEESAELF